MFLVTRDVESSQEVEKILQSYGFSTFIEPLLTLDTSPAFCLLQAVENFLQETKAKANTSSKSLPVFIITSKNAVKSLFSLSLPSIEMNFILMLLLKKLCRVIVVGTATKNLLITNLDILGKNQYNTEIDCMIKTFINVNELYNFILCSVSKTSTMVYLSGENIKQNIDAELAEQGYVIKRFIAYRMLASENFSFSLIDKIKKGELRYVMLYSVRTAQIFLNLVEKHELFYEASKLVFFVLSKEIAEVIGYNNVIYPVLPDNYSLIKCILNYLH